MSGNQALEFSQNLPIVFAHDTFVLIDYYSIIIVAPELWVFRISRSSCQGCWKHMKTQWEDFNNIARQLWNTMKSIPTTFQPGHIQTFPFCRSGLSLLVKRGSALSKGTSSRCPGGVPILGWNILASHFGKMPFRL